MKPRACRHACTLGGNECDFVVGYTGGLLVGMLLTPHLEAFLLWSLFVAFESWRCSRRRERERRWLCDRLPEARVLRLAATSSRALTRSASVRRAGLAHAVPMRPSRPQCGGRLRAQKRTISYTVLPITRGR